MSITIRFGRASILRARVRPRRRQGLGPALAAALLCMLQPGASLADEAPISIDSRFAPVDDSLGDGVQQFVSYLGQIGFGTPV
jgi:hypothetical protein